MLVSRCSGTDEGSSVVAHLNPNVRVRQQSRVQYLHLNLNTKGEYLFPKNMTKVEFEKREI